MLRHVFVLSLAGVVCFAAGPSARQSHPRTVYVSVVDKQGIPIMDVRAPELAVIEDGTSRPALTVTPAPSPGKIAVIVDDHGLGLPEVRQGLQQFAGVLRGRAIGVLATGRPDPVLMGFTTDPGSVSKGIDRLVPGNDDGIVFLEQLFVTAKQFQANRSDRNVVVALTVDMDCASTSAERGTSPEHSAYDNFRQTKVTYCSDYQQPPHAESARAFAWQDVAEEVRKSRATMFSVVVRHRRDGDHGPIFDATASVSGGNVELPMTDSAIASSLSRIATQITSQYAVTYDSPAGKAGARLQITSARPGVTVRAPERVY